jgi:hypothetical protein
MEIGQICSKPSLVKCEREDVIHALITQKEGTTMAMQKEVAIV